MSKANIELSSLKKWTASIKSDSQTQLVSSIAQHAHIDDVLINRARELKAKMVFNNKVDPEGSPVLDQKSSGRCWLFASTNMLRINAMSKLNLKECQISPSYLFFYDKLEKANFFLEQIIDTYKEPVDGRLVQYLLDCPIIDGGQFDMMTQVVDKYGLVPNQIFPDTFNTTMSRTMNRLITFKLREYGMILRDLLNNNQDISSKKEEFQFEIYRLLTMFLGIPPDPNESFTWEFYDKDGKYKSLTSTPLDFATKTLEFDTPQYVSLLNDPRNSYNKMIQIDRLGNITGGKYVSYLNLDIKKLSQAVINRIRNNKAVFFGTDTPKFMDKKQGIMDIDLWDYKLMGYDPKSMSKKDRVIYKNSLMTHAMLITAVHLDDNGNPVRYRVENSWGTKSGNDGYYVMNQEYFEEYVYQIVCEKDELAALDIDLSILEDSNPIILPPYDPMGALAFKDDH
ncbi:bleomycin hydrolase [Martiniozyma asiatica (nom. inval.)]|nr:bleomycin hydrolase [Martiniozyma asiatica]